MSILRAGAAFALPSLVALGCAGSSAVASNPESDSRLPERVSVPGSPELCGNALDDNGNGLADEGCGISTSSVAFLVAWDEPDTDVDLRVTDPNGELVEVGRPTESGLVRERDCPGREGECRGKNFETIYQEQGEPARGKYLVRVLLVSLGGATPPVAVRFSARLGGRAYSRSLSLARTDADWVGEFVF